MKPSTLLPRFHRAMAVFVVTTLVTPISVLAQAPAPAAGAPPAMPPTTQTLKILSMTSSLAMNDLERQVMSPLAVQILDQNDRPVEGATVIFRFPLNGPSAIFADRQTGQTLRTGANGQARAIGWTANGQVGPFAVQVTATRGNEMGIASIPMTNVSRILPESEMPKKRWWTSKWAKIGYIAGAAGITAAIILSNRSSSTTLRGGPGAPVIGGPQ